MEIKRKEIVGIGAIILGVIIAFLIFTSSYTVDQTEYAVLITFGRPSPDIVGPGLKFKAPYPIQRVKKLSRETFSLTLGYHETREGVVPYDNEAKMITGDENIILADLEVQYRITDPLAYLYNTEDPVNVLYNATSASLRGVIGSSSVDDALTDGRTRIINEVRDSLTTLINTYNIGVAIVNVNLQDVDLPNQTVSDAFKKVTSAREERITKINEATRYRNELLNTAEGKKEAIISNAEAEKVKRIEEAKGNVATFNALYAAYADNKAITRKRLIIETLDQVLPDVKLYIMDDSGGTVKYLPIDATKGAKQ